MRRTRHSHSTHLFYLSYVLRSIVAVMTLAFLPELNKNIERVLSKNIQQQAFSNNFEQNTCNSLSLLFNYNFYKSCFHFIDHVGTSLSLLFNL